MVVTRQKALKNDISVALSGRSQDGMCLSGADNSKSQDQRTSVASVPRENCALASVRQDPAAITDAATLVSNSLAFTTSQQAANKTSDAAPSCSTELLAESMADASSLKQTVSSPSVVSGMHLTSSDSGSIVTTQVVPEYYTLDNITVISSHCAQFTTLASTEVVASAGGVMSKSGSGTENHPTTSVQDVSRTNSRSNPSCRTQPFSAVKFTPTQAISNTGSGYVVPSLTAPSTNPRGSCIPNISILSSELKLVPTSEHQHDFTAAEPRYISVSAADPSSNVEPEMLTDSASQDHSEVASAVLDIPNRAQNEEEIPVQLTWTKCATLKLLELYKEHEIYLKDPHYKKKSVWERIAARMNTDPNDPIQYHWNQVENKWKNLTKKYRDCISSNRCNGTNHKCPFFDQLAAIYNYYPGEAHKTAVEGLRALGYSLKTHHVSNDAVPGADVTTTPTALLKRDHRSLADVGDIKEDEPKTIPLPKKKKKYERQGQLRSLTSATQKMGTLIPAQPVPLSRIPSFISSDAPSSASGGLSSSDQMTVNYDSIIATIKQLGEDRNTQVARRMERLEQMHQEKIHLFRQFLDIIKQGD